MTTDRNALPQFKGRPVPWVTRWTSEISNSRYDLAFTRKDGHLTYADGNNQYDKHGVLWQREGIGRGGEPDWASVSTYRQKISMERRKCQVCGDKIADGPIHWLMPLDEGYDVFNEGEDNETFLTWNPPTCEGCIPLALELCPHLKRNGYQILKVLDYEVWGVTGLTMVVSDGQAFPMQTFVPYDEAPDLPIPETDLVQQQKRIMAQQIIVKLGKYVIEERQAGSRPQETPEDIEQKARNFLRNLLGDDLDEDALEEEIRKAAWEEAVASGWEPEAEVR